MKINPYLFFYKKSAYLLLFFILMSLFLMNFNSSFKLAGIRYFLLSTIQFINSVENRIILLQDARSENQELKERLFEVNLANQRIKEALLENIRLRRMLQFKKESNLRFVPAKVIGTGIEKGVRSIILDAGEMDSVSKNMAVLNHEGLIGKIIVTTSSHSIAQILMDHNSLVSARLQKSRETGVIAWSGNSWLDLLYIPKNIEVEKGEVVLTSGLSRIYPPGVKIGVVSEIEVNEYTLFQKIKVKPMVNFNAIEEAFIIIDSVNQPAETATGE